MNIFWFRRDLRLNNNRALFESLSDDLTLPIFIFDKNILNKLPKNDKRVAFIHKTISELNKQLSSFNSGIKVLYDAPIEAFKKLLSEYSVSKVYANHDYEPYASARDSEIKSLLESHNVTFETFKDQVIYEKNEVLKSDGTPYTVFTPYSKKWTERFNNESLKSFNSESLLSNIYSVTNEIISLEEMGFLNNNYQYPSKELNKSILSNYHNTRDIPSLLGTTRLSLHLRFGTISIRDLIKNATANSTYLNELIWREFYMMILWHYPHVVTNSFKSKYDSIRWENNEEHIKLWKEGRTGYPIVDAGMRELNEKGYMHNRVRMITASFFTKHLLCDWRIGEAYFAEKLLDYELSSNNGGWQWAAGSGCDAAPYFRVFNPELQTKKFDPELKYIRKWVPEFENPFEYPQPIVEHKFARERALARYKEALK